MLQPLDIPKWKWESISMDFLVRLPCTLGARSLIWVIVGRLTKWHISYLLRLHIRLFT